MKNLSDIELILAYRQSHDKTLCGELFKRHTTFVFGVCMKYFKDRDDSSDAVMQIFEKLFTDLLKHDIQNFRAWLHTVARNHCLMQLRSRSKFEDKQISIDETFVPVMESNHQLHQHDEKEQMLTIMEKAIPELNEKQRICIELFYLREKSYQEVAVETGYSINDVKSYIQNGKRNLKIIITKNMNLAGAFLIVMKFLH